MEDVEKRTPFDIAGGNVTQCGHLVKQPAVSQKVKHQLAIRPGNCTAWHFPKEIKAMSTQDLSMNVHGSATHNSPKGPFRGKANVPKLGFGDGYTILYFHHKKSSWDLRALIIKLLPIYYDSSFAIKNY